MVVYALDALARDRAADGGSRSGIRKVQPPKPVRSSRLGAPEQACARRPMPGFVKRECTTTNHRLLWIFLALVAVATLALVGALQLYNAFGSQLSGRDLFVSAQSPEDRGNLKVNRVPRQVIVSSINGQSSVVITLGSDQQAAVSRRIDGMQLTGFELARAGYHYDGGSVNRSIPADCSPPRWQWRSSPLHPVARR